MRSQAYEIAHYAAAARYRTYRAHSNMNHQPDAAVELIKRFRPFLAEPLQYLRGLWIVGHAHTRTLRAGMCITADQAHDLLIEDLSIIRRMIARVVTVPLNQNQKDALASFAFDLGIATFERSKLVELLNRGWYDQVPAQMVRWTRLDGDESKDLARRRRFEASLFVQQIGGK